MIRNYLLTGVAITMAITATAQTAPRTIKENATTSVKNQGRSGTCWNFSTTSLLESESLRKSNTSLDLSEMFSARNVYIEKAKNYILREGKAQFSEGGLGHDLIQAISKYGAIPQEAYSGMTGEIPNHSGLDGMLKSYLDSILALPRPVPSNWMGGYLKVLATRFPEPPATFNYQGKTYTPLSFAKEVLKFDANDYVNITSFTHHPFYHPFVLEAPDNFSNGSFYNLPLQEMISLVNTTLKSGYTIMWDADVSNKDFNQKKGYALLFADSTDLKATEINADSKERAYSQELRQQLYENLTTQDDHLMHLVGLEQSAGGKIFYKVKNSWGPVGPFKGYIQVSEAYFAINTVSLIIPKQALPKVLKEKLGIK